MAMDGLAGAIATAGLALFAKLYIDWLERARERRSVAAAIAGELTAYLTLLKPVQFATNLRNLKYLNSDELKARLAAFPELPNSHPVFDKISEKLGRLPVQEIVDISAAYNVVTGMRLHIKKWPSEEFLRADRFYQIAVFEAVADAVERQAGPASNLINRLEWIARQGSWSAFLVGSDPPIDLPATRFLAKLLSPPS